MYQICIIDNLTLIIVNVLLSVLGNSLKQLFRTRTSFLEKPINRAEYFMYPQMI